MGTFIVGAILVIAVGLIIWKMVKDKKNGKGCCGDCGSCKGCH
ncbi:MAG: FeoB-associated Cys-rich membrane protein [Lachnospiraceae bacterium]|jgi:sugar phosphate permease|nr:FeoB-associated Cys-rich membrane protein [Lachnospiraceae bacterium]